MGLISADLVGRGTGLPLFQTVFKDVCLMELLEGTVSPPVTLVCLVSSVTKTLTPSMTKVRYCPL